jgi:hypothetical protein
MDNTQISDASDQRQERLLTTLERLLELPVIDVNDTFQQAVQLITEVLDADKVDVFFHDTSTDTLVARGTSDTPMGRRQKAIGLDRMPLANGGRMIEVFLTGNSFINGALVANSSHNEVHFIFSIPIEKDDVPEDDEPFGSAL